MAQTFEVTVLVPVMSGVYQCTSDLEPVAYSTTTHELRAEVTFFGPYEDSHVSWLDVAVLEDLNLNANQLQGAEEQAIDLAVQKLAEATANKRAQEDMARIWHDFSDLRERAS